MGADTARVANGPGVMSLGHHQRRSCFTGDADTPALSVL